VGSVVRREGGIGSKARIISGHSGAEKVKECGGQWRFRIGELGCAKQQVVLPRLTVGCRAGVGIEVVVVGNGS